MCSEKIEHKLWLPSIFDTFFCIVINHSHFHLIRLNARPWRRRHSATVGPRAATTHSGSPASRFTRWTTRPTLVCALRTVLSFYSLFRKKINFLLKIYAPRQVDPIADPQFFVMAFIFILLGYHLFKFRIFKK